MYPQDKIRESWSDEEREGGTDIQFAVQPQEYLKFRFGQENDQICSRLLVFGKTGADGSERALWLDDNGDTKIVHMGSGSGSVLCCVYLGR